MKNKYLYLSALFFLLLITGMFWGTWFTLTRSLEQFSSDEFTHIGKVIIANVAWPMRFIMPTGILLVLLSLWFFPNKKSNAFYLGVTSFVLIIAVLLITLLVLVPIDYQIKEWTSSTIPKDWESLRNTWKTFHEIRTFASLLSFVCFSYFIYSLKEK